MQNAEGLKPDQISEFLKASEGIDFVGQKRAEIYGWIQQVLVAQEYGRQSKKQRGSIRAYLSTSFRKYGLVFFEAAMQWADCPISIAVWQGLGE